ncbi:MAG: UDP-N-acetylmuramoyl-L-alanine--D-glutamate ligase [bacterium]|nr:UDP-N-acetylmuramoyl-L-alanine--D-glutamate ligase [bacterium]
MAGNCEKIVVIKVDFKNKKVVIFGLGIYEKGSGISAALFFAKKGAKLLITDLKTKKELRLQLKQLKKYKNIKYVLGRHRKKDFKNADFIFKNPGVPKDSLYLKTARQNKIPIINDWTIFFEKKPNNLLIGVTGTKGKSTTTALIYEILKAAKKDAVLCGNIGQSPLAILNKIKKNTIVVAELSSWLLQEFKNSPQIAVITNLMPDHLDKYKNKRDYYKDKANIFRFQSKNDYLILNKNNKDLKKLAKKTKSKIIWFSPKTKYSAAIAVAKLLGIFKNTVKMVIKNFKGISGRLELTREKSGVKYYNDTTATTPDATIYALRSLKKHKNKIILITGGMDKKLNYKNLAKEIPKYCKTLILFEGTASDKIIKELRIKNYELRINISSMKKAVKIALEFAEKDDIILLSPASASFNMFKNEFDRGNQFVKIVKSL